MRQVRHVYLDKRTARLFEIRTKQAALVKEEQEELRLSLRYMHDHKVRAYLQNGMELEKVEGAEKLRARMTKETATEMLSPEGVDGGDTQDEAPEAGAASAAAADSGRLEP